MDVQHTHSCVEDVFMYFSVASPSSTSDLHFCNHKKFHIFFDYVPSATFLNSSPAAHTNQPHSQTHIQHSQYEWIVQIYTNTDDVRSCVYHAYEKGADNVKHFIVSNLLYVFCSGGESDIECRMQCKQNYIIFYYVQFYAMT